jgi:hypothetical protein
MDIRNANARMPEGYKIVVEGEGDQVQWGFRQSIGQPLEYIERLGHFLNPETSTKFSGLQTVFDQTSHRQLREILRTIDNNARNEEFARLMKERREVLGLRPRE